MNSIDKYAFSACCYIISPDNLLSTLSLFSYSLQIYQKCFFQTIVCINFFSLHILKSTFLSTCQANKYIRDIIDKTTILISIRIIVHIMNLKESSICFLVFPWSISNQFILLYCLSSSHVVYVVEEISYYSDYCYWPCYSHECDEQEYCPFELYWVFR